VATQLNCDAVNRAVGNLTEKFLILATGRNRPPYYALVSHLDLQLAQLIIVHDPVIFPVDVGLLFIFIYLFQYCLAISRRISVTHR
jgi:hypothetical protein